MSFGGFLPSINSSYNICCDFNIHVDVPVGDSYKFITSRDSRDKQLVNQPTLDSCDKQLVNQPTHLHGHIFYLILSPSDQDTIIDVKICNYLIMH